MSTIKLKHSGGNSVSLNPPTSAPTSSEVAFKLPNADGSSGQYMKTDGSGNLAFATVATPVAGITVWDTWLLTASTLSGEQTITSNLARPTTLPNGAAWGFIGTGMTESSGVFTFPQTGMWQIVADFFTSNNQSNTQQYQIGYIKVSTDSGSSYENFAQASQASVGYGTSSIHCSGLLDVTNISTYRVQFHLNDQVGNSNFTIDGSTDGRKRTGFEFRRIGDT